MRLQSPREQALGRAGKLRPGDAADQVMGKPIRRHLREPRLQFRGHVGADRARCQALVEQPGPRLRQRQGLGQQGAEIEHRDVALAQGIDEGVVFLPGLLDPQHVVEQQRLAVLRVRRCRLRSGRWTMTSLSLPISEWTPSSVMMLIPLGCRLRRYETPASGSDGAVPHQVTATTAATTSPAASSNSSGWNRRAPASRRAIACTMMPGA